MQAERDVHPSLPGLGSGHLLRVKGWPATKMPITSQQQQRSDPRLCRLS